MYRIPFLIGSIAASLAAGYELFYEQDPWRLWIAIGLTSLYGLVFNAIVHFNEVLGVYESNDSPPRVIDVTPREVASSIVD